MKITDYILQFFVVLNLKLVSLVDPRRAEKAKRMLFLTSLAVSLSNEGVIQKYSKADLNSDMGLAKNIESLLAAEEMALLIWGKTELKKKFDSVSGEMSLTDMERISNDLISETPDWIKYDSNKMRFDLKEFFVTRTVE